MNRIPLLTARDIEVKVKKVQKNGAVALLYKTARVDMAVLDEVFGPLNWQADYKTVKDNLYCGIGARESADQDFVWKWDCGIESREDGEGNKKKGEASDAFKRAGFKWGIGRELYTAPQIVLAVETKETGKTAKGATIYGLENPFQSFNVVSIDYDENRNIIQVIIEDDRGRVVFPRESARTLAAAEKKAAPVANPAKDLRDDDGEGAAQYLRWAENTSMPQGKHKGETLGSIETDYLLWYVENGYNAELRKKCAAVAASRNAKLTPIDGPLPF